MATDASGCGALAFELLLMQLLLWAHQIGDCERELR